MRFSCIFAITFWCTMYISEKSSAMRVEKVVIQTDFEGSNPFIEENSETDPDLERKNKNPISEDENFVIQTDDEGFSVISEENSETDTSDLERKNKNPISGDENVVIQTDEGVSVISEESSETVSSDIQRKGKNKKSKSVRNCLDLKKQGKSSGAYLITPCDDTPARVVNVYCDMDTDGGGWTVIQRRDNYPKQQDFYNTWYEYAVGFGDVLKDFWLGNDNIHCLTDQSYNELRVDIALFSGSTYYTKYGFFYIDDRSNKYKLNVQNYTGNGGDRLTPHNNMTFSTYDADNDIWSYNCAYSYKSGWWYNACWNSHLNGLYNSSSSQGMYWNSFGIKKSEMKIRPTY